MTSNMNCSIFYSVNGMPFKICDRYNNENVYRAYTMVYINTGVTAPLLSIAGDDSHEEVTAATSLSIPNEIMAGPFFIHETHCIIVNGKNQILRLGDNYRFPINLYRSFDDPSKLRVFFCEKENKHTPTWVSF